MPLAFDLEYTLYNLNDSAEINAYVFDANDAPIPQSELASVLFTVQDPTGNETILNGSITADGTGYARFLGTEYVGHYNTIATFTLASGQVKSVVCSFEVIDPFNPPAPSSLQVIGDMVWAKIEDVFDSELGGPWLRDMTLNFFSKDKMPEFIAEGLFDMNQQNPPTNLTADYFVLNGVATSEAPLVVEATYLAVILHLVGSYVEQPLPLGGQVVYEDRRDYIERWLQIYEVEMQRYIRWVALWKRRFLGLDGHTHNIIVSKAGRVAGPYMPNIYSGRGTW